MRAGFLSATMIAALLVSGCATTNEKALIRRADAAIVKQYPGLDLVDYRRITGTTRRGLVSVIYAKSRPVAPRELDMIIVEFDGKGHVAKIDRLGGHATRPLR